jgi:beta-glucanase (GH16 family)
MSQTFYDDFTGAAGSPPDPTRWTVRTNGLPADAVQALTTAPANCHQDGGTNLVMTATRVPQLQQPGDIAPAPSYSSAYIQSKFTQQYGTFQARIKTPSGAGMWPAFWMVGLDPAQKWPACGEIDIFEQVPGVNATETYAHIHGPGFVGSLLGGGYALLPKGVKFSDEFHDYGVTWKPGSITFTLDGERYADWSTLDMEPGMEWPFDACGPMCIRLSLAVGGVWPGMPTPATPFPQEMLVNWVAAYSL